ncbi:hypothetical protein [Polyangium sp. 15x6]|uniref:hypothetical protein n=1 Tax=Polyangium sp. 15x6 TaxID=3042687 RepID=UPI00249CE7C5|nr:hypothetical protein [Polyangium sp. 15x6]MDI3291281.1 hypothetical protein [Polyangium sp. 15x6]
MAQLVEILGQQAPPPRRGHHANTPSEAGQLCGQVVDAHGYAADFGTSGPRRPLLLSLPPPPRYGRAMSLQLTPLGTLTEVHEVV